MKKLLVLIYGITNYNLGSAALVFLVGFLFNLLAPLEAVLGFDTGIDSGEAGNPALSAIIDIFLIALFGLQHSIMARPWFKRRLQRHIPEAAERSTYMLATAIAVFAMCLLWQPLPHVLWQAESDVLFNIMLGIGLAGWALVLYSTFLINHFDLFGLRQVWLYFLGKEYTQLPFRVSSLYRYVRHPIMTGAFIGIWFTPVMTIGHLLFAIGMSSYIIIGVYHEEKDLIAAFGERYREYMRSTARFFPFTAKGDSPDNGRLATDA
jgi:protein-S-isoprenylcysteine O-methyltransferase Ste14